MCQNLTLPSSFYSILFCSIRRKTPLPDDEKNCLIDWLVSSLNKISRSNRNERKIYYAFLVWLLWNPKTICLGSWKNCFLDFLGLTPFKFTRAIETIGTPESQASQVSKQWGTEIFFWSFSRCEVPCFEKKFAQQLSHVSLQASFYRGTTTKLKATKQQLQAWIIWQLEHNKWIKQVT